MDLRRFVRDVPDFPRPGIVFRDITPLLLDPGASRQTLAGLAAAAHPLRPDLVVGIEARGLIFGAALALELGAGFVVALGFLGGRDRLARHPVHSLIVYE